MNKEELIKYIKDSKNGTPREVWNDLEEQPIEVQIQAIIKAVKWQELEMNLDYLKFKDNIYKRIKSLEESVEIIEGEVFKDE